MAWRSWGLSDGYSQILACTLLLIRYRKRNRHCASASVHSVFVLCASIMEVRVLWLSPSENLGRWSLNSLRLWLDTRFSHLHCACSALLWGGTVLQPDDPVMLYLHNHFFLSCFLQPASHYREDPFPLLSTKSLKGMLSLSTDELMV